MQAVRAVVPIDNAEYLALRMDKIAAVFANEISVDVLVIGSHSAPHKSSFIRR
jgi:hypothetical protein